MYRQDFVPVEGGNANILDRRRKQRKRLKAREYIRMSAAGGEIEHRSFGGR
jgi:hypothetical protein